MNNHTRLYDLIDRLNRMTTSLDWGDGLNPAQRSALTYLSRANRFSRSPSHVADYLCSTRGTTSQTLKALMEKGLIVQSRSDADRRSISLGLTNRGRELLSKISDIEAVLNDLDTKDASKIADGIEEIMMRILKHRAFRLFGQCKSCAYHQSSDGVLYCKLLKTDLKETEAEQTCHEYQAQKRS